MFMGGAISGTGAAKEKCAANNKQRNRHEGK